MARGRTNPALVTRIGGDGTRRRVPVRLLAEEAMDVRLDDRLVTTVVRTPGHDYELAVGRLFADGLIGLRRVHEVRYCATGSAVDTGFNVVSVGAAPAPPSVTAPALAAPRPAPPIGFDREVALAAVAAAEEARELLRLTGAGSAAGAFASATGAIAVLREDASPDNALDKVIGRLHLDGRLPAAGDADALYVSATVDESVVARARTAGFALVVGAGAATSAAVAAAAVAGITLAGGTRDGHVTLYQEAPGA